MPHAHRNRLLINETPSSYLHFCCIDCHWYGHRRHRRHTCSLNSMDCEAILCDVMASISAVPLCAKNKDEFFAGSGSRGWECGLAFYLQIIIFHQYFGFVWALTHRQQQNELNSYRQAYQQRRPTDSFCYFIQSCDHKEWEGVYYAIEREREGGEGRERTQNSVWAGGGGSVRSARMVVIAPRK